MDTYPNPLTIEERLSVGRLLDHDFRQVNGCVVGAATSSVKYKHKFPKYGLYALRLSEAIVNSVMIMQRPVLYLNSPKRFEKLDFNSLVVESGKSAGIEMKFKLDYDFENDAVLPEVMICTLWNWVRNAGKAARFVGQDNLCIKVGVSKTNNLSEVVYVPSTAIDTPKYLAFSVNDNGPGFPKDKDLVSCLTNCPDYDKSGFGLYFSGLVAKAFRCKIGMHSVPGNTTFTLYHPLIK